MTNSKNKFVRVSLIVFACVLSAMLLFLPFLIKDKRSVFADSTSVETYSFSGSQILFGITARDVYNSNTGNYYSSNYAMMNFQIPYLALDSTNPSNFTFNFYSSLYYIKRETENTLSYVNYSKTFSFPLGTYNDFYVALKSSYNQSNSRPYFFCWVSSDIDFNFDVQYVQLESIQDSNDSNIYTFHIRYFDSNAKKVQFSFNGISLESQSIYNCVPSGLQGALPLTAFTRPDVFSTRTYYFSNAISNFSDNSYYQQGVSDGYNNGLIVGDSQGYERGYSNGYSVGERTGFNDGVASANDYSFLGLFGAIVDAPLQAFTGMFDFNLSFDGVHNFNLKGFFLAMLSIAIVIAIIRFALSK